MRSQAYYEPTARPHCVRVTRKMGKWHLYGYVHNGIQYLHAHEALHLMEMVTSDYSINIHTAIESLSHYNTSLQNRLEVYYNKVIVSLQQAYALLLGSTVTAEAYFVYSNLMRAGYVAELHDRANDRHQPSAPAAPSNFRDARKAKQQSRQYTQCVWKCYALLQSNRLASVAADSKDPMLKSIAAAMNAIADKIRSPVFEAFGVSNATSDDDDNEVDNGWNVQAVDLKRNPKESPQKNAPTSKEYPAELFLDRNLIADQSPEMGRFQNVFRTIRTIEISSSYTQNRDRQTDEQGLRFDFDLFIATSSFRKSDPGQPDYRIVVRKSTDGVPSRRAILQTFLRQSHRARILVVFVSGAMSMQAYSYTFAK